ncbi:MAG TPA: hypothetical protein PLW93_01820 [Candidatus Absconditabacterales bacterium]|nr:hypothetical protein [Candidatus Absconditabacterales bacterium]HNG96987.1 hypothetical protein [Candidatus Absconditabacterales bacterium]
MTPEQQEVCMTEFAHKLSDSEFLKHYNRFGSSAGFYFFKKVLSESQHSIIVDLQNTLLSNWKTHQKSDDKNIKNITWAIDDTLLASPSNDGALDYYTLQNKFVEILESKNMSIISENIDKYKETFKVLFKHLNFNRRQLENEIKYKQQNPTTPLEFFVYESYCNNKPINM